MRPESGAKFLVSVAKDSQAALARQLARQAAAVTGKRDALTHALSDGTGGRHLFGMPALYLFEIAAFDFRAFLGWAF